MVHRKSNGIIIFTLMASLSLHAQNTFAEKKAKETEAKMTDDERFSLITSLVGYVPTLGIPKDDRIPDDILMSAGYTPGIPRLGIPNLQSTDASMGVTNPGYRPNDKGATAMPSAILVGSSFNPILAYRVGEAIAKEARIRGFNVLLAGGINLIRDVRNGRNYEYYSEDPWATALFGAAAVNGIQHQKVISTLKHYSLNSNETNRHWLDAIIDPAAHRESDLLAFQIAIEKSNPGSIMGGYNKINGEYASGNHYLLNELLKRDWKYKGYVMSDWGAVPSWDYALKGLDQESGIQLDVMQWGAEAFTDSLRHAYQNDHLPKERLSDMVQRILYAMYAVGVMDWKEKIKVDTNAHHQIALATAREGMVLLKNDQNILPLDPNKKMKIAVIGGNAHLGVYCGTGSGAVLPESGYAAKINIGGTGIMSGGRTLYLIPTSPLSELQRALPHATIDFDPGYTIAEAKLWAKQADIVIAFGSRVEGEGFDLVDLSLPQGQDQLIDEIAQVNPNTIVVLQTGNAVHMPWKDKVKAILQAWFPGQGGAQAIAEILTGQVNPSGKLPLTFPTDLDQTPRPSLAGLGTPWGTPTTIIYNEGADVGYRWYANRELSPMFSFGYGLSYTHFEISHFKIEHKNKLQFSVTVKNTGAMKGAEVPQLYLEKWNETHRFRLVAFDKVELQPGESKTIHFAIDPRLIADFDWKNQHWRVNKGTYTFAIGNSSTHLEERITLELKENIFKD